jgi:peptidoglycan hydrolase-like protein with peptidoglycan-binding domain
MSSRPSIGLPGLRSCLRGRMPWAQPQFSPGFMVALGVGLAVGSSGMPPWVGVPAILRFDSVAAAATPVENRPALQKGSTGAPVKELQATLKLMGWYSGVVDGVYGEDTATAVAQFQRSTGLIADGVVGPDTWNRLFPANPEFPVPGSPVTGPAATAPGLPSSAAPVAPNPSNNGFPAPGSGSASGSAPTAGTSTAAIVPPLSPGSLPGAASPGATSPGTASPSPTSPTRAAVVSPPPATLPILRLGMSGPAVEGLQVRLQAIGVFKGAADGVFGPETQAAVKTAQRRLQLEPDGVVGPSTWIALLKR